MNYAEASHLWQQGKSVIVSEGSIKLPVLGHVERETIGPCEYIWTFCDFYTTVQFMVFESSVDGISGDPEKLTYRLAE